MGWSTKPGQVQTGCRHLVKSGVVIRIEKTLFYRTALIRIDFSR